MNVVVHKRLWSLLAVLKLNASEFVATIGLLDRIEAELNFRDDVADDPINDRLKYAIELSIEELRKNLHSLGLNFTFMAVDRLTSLINSELCPLRNRELQSHIEKIRNRIKDELNFIQLYVVDSKNSGLLESAEPFGSDVPLKFPDVAGDIEEAAKCLALRRGTASVFHLMRVMESAVQALSVKLSIHNTSRVWGILLADINKEVQAMPKGKKRIEWFEIATLLYQIKEAWRNETMHPNVTYTEEQAEEIFMAVKTFMNRLCALV